jgi:hypothetical protein
VLGVVSLIIGTEGFAVGCRGRVWAARFNTRVVSQQ